MSTWPKSMTDKGLCDILLEKASLTEMQLADIVALAARVNDGGRLGWKERDRMMAIAMAQGLTIRSQIKSNKRPLSTNPGDCYSTVATRGTQIAQVILARGRTPSGHMLAPPGKRRVG